MLLQDIKVRFGTMARFEIQEIDCGMFGLRRLSHTILSAVVMSSSLYYALTLKSRVTAQQWFECTDQTQS